MPAANFQSYKLTSNELSSSAKQNNMIQAIEDAVNSIDNAKVASNAAIAVSKLAAGNNGDLLTTAAGVPTWSALPATGYTPTLTQSGAVTKTVTVADYVQIGKLVTVWFRLDITGAGTTNNPILVGLPVTANATHGANGFELGAGEILDNGTALYHVLWRFNSTTTIAALRNDTLSTTPVGQDPNYAVANTDYVKGFVTYLAA